LRFHQSFAADLSVVRQHPCALSDSRPMPRPVVFVLLVVLTACTTRQEAPGVAARVDLLRVPPDSGSRLLAWPLHDTARTSADVAIVIAIQNGLQERPIYVDPAMLDVILLDPTGRVIAPASNAWREGHRGTVRLPRGGFYGEVLNLSGSGLMRTFDLPGPGTYRAVVSYHAVPPPPGGPPVTDRTFPTLSSDTVRVTLRPEPSDSL
jgi:hypothetical protein